jgi:hypothetical protein
VIELEVGTAEVLAKKSQAENLHAAHEQDGGDQ